MAIMMWYQERRETDGSHNVVSTKIGWRSHCGVRREHMAVTMWFQQRVDDDHNVVSRENIWQSQCGFNGEWMAITVWYQERNDNHLCVIATEHRLSYFDNSTQQFRQYIN